MTNGTTTDVARGPWVRVPLGPPGSTEPTTRVATLSQALGPARPGESPPRRRPPARAAGNRPAPSPPGPPRRPDGPGTRTPRRRPPSARRKRRRPPRPPPRVPAAHRPRTAPQAAAAPGAPRGGRARAGRRGAEPGADGPGRGHRERRGRGGRAEARGRRRRGARRLTDRLGRALRASRVRRCGRREGRGGHDPDSGSESRRDGIRGIDGTRRSGRGTRRDGPVGHGTARGAPAGPRGRPRGRRTGHDRHPHGARAVAAAGRARAAPHAERHHPRPGTEARFPRALRADRGNLRQQPDEPAGTRVAGAGQGAGSSARGRTARRPAGPGAVPWSPVGARRQPRHLATPPDQRITRAGPRRTGPERGQVRGRLPASTPLRPCVPRPADTRARRRTPSRRGSRDSPQGVSDSSRRASSHGSITPRPRTGRCHIGWRAKR